MNKILLVEDDSGLAGMISDYLAGEGFVVDCVHDGSAASASTPTGYDLVILDVMLPNRSGFEVLKAIRQHSNIPVILLTARDNETDRVVGLELGGDDYIPKPFRPRELVARIRAVLRRTERGVTTNLPPVGLQIGDVKLDPAARIATRNGHNLNLTTAESEMLRHFLGMAGMPVSRDDLARICLGRGKVSALDRNVDTLVSKLRRKLGSEDIIKTVRNVGYIYTLPSSAPR